MKSPTQGGGEVVVVVKFSSIIDEVPAQEVELLLVAVVTVEPTLSLAHE